MTKPYAKETLIRDHLGLAKAIAVQNWQTATYALEVDEMISLANLGLVDAANRWEKYCEKNSYDPAAVEYFKVFAARRIHGTIRDGIRQNDWATRTLRDKAKKLKLAGQDDGLSVAQLAEKTGMSVKEINNTIHRMATRPVSLDSSFCGWSDYGVEPNNISYTIDSVSTDGTAFEHDMLKHAADVIRTLPQDQQVVLALHYYEALEIRSVARELGITESRASQLHTKAVLTIRQALLEAASESGHV